MGDDRSRVAAWTGLVSLGLARLKAKAVRTAPRQVALTVAGVAIPVALMLVVTSVSIGLAGGQPVASEDVDYWIVPESEAGSAVVETGGPQFGRVHTVAERLASRDRVQGATPVLLTLLRAQRENRSEFVLAVGVVPAEDPISIAGVSTAGLTPGDPAFANGSYTGPPTEEAVVSDGAASLLDLSAGTSLTLGTGADTDRDFQVAALSETGGQFAGLPVVLVHLSELQLVTGAADGDRADQLLVRSSDPAIRPSLENVYPRSMVIARGDVGVGQVAESDLALAVALTGLLVAIIVGTLSAATTVGLTVAADAPQRALLGAIGLSRRSLALVVTTEALSVTLLGGLVGSGLGLAAIPAVNRLGRRFVADVTVATFNPWLAGYGLAVSLVIGVLVIPYLLYLGRETDTLEVLYD